MSRKVKPMVHKNAIYDDVAFDRTAIYSVINNPNNGVVYKKAANFMGIKQIETNLETSIGQVKIEFLSVITSKIETLDVDLEVIGSTSEITKLLKYGLDVNSTNKNIIIKHFRNCLQNANVSFNHTEIGFTSTVQETYFKHYGLLGTPNKSKYVGNFNIRPNGTFKKWIEIVNQEVVGNYALESILALAFSAPLLAYIADLTNLDSQIVHLVGDSSVGKSTSIVLAMSLFSRPIIENGSLIFQWNSTNNAIVKKLTGNYGIPVGIDESSMSKNKDFTPMLYVLAGGQESDRLTKDIKERSGGSWKTVIFSTGEHGLLSKSANNTGLMGRISEYKNVTWTKDATNSNAIKTGFSQNYGHAGPMLVEYLLEQDKNIILKRYNDWHEKLNHDLEKSQVKGRLAQKLALVMLSSEMANEAINLNLNTKQIYTFLLSHESKKVDDLDLARKAFEYLNDLITINVDRFVKQCGKEKEFNNKSGECWGCIYSTANSSVDRIALSELKFKELLTGDQKFQSSEIILDAFLKKKWIIRGKDRIVQRISVNGMGRSNYVVLNVKQIEADLYGA